MTKDASEAVSDFMAALMAMDMEAARRLLRGPGGEPVPVEEAEALIVPALERIGLGWEDGSVALSQVYMSGRQCESLMNELRPVVGTDRADGARVAIVVLEDYHFLGMRLVSSVLRASGFALLDYGRMDADAVVARVLADEVDVLLVSVLMLRSALRVRYLRDRLDASGRKVALAVGGAPFRLDKGLWKEMGADGTSDTASGAVALVRRLVEGGAR